MTTITKKRDCHVDMGDHFTYVDQFGNVARCISCNKPIEYVKYDEDHVGCANHHCSEAHENRRQAASNSRQDAGDYQRGLSYRERLSMGFAFMDGKRAW